MEYQSVKKIDQQVYDAIISEENRQKNGLELIPSENYVPNIIKQT